MIGVPVPQRGSRADPCQLEFLTTPHASMQTSLPTVSIDVLTAAKDIYGIVIESSLACL